MKHVFYLNSSRGVSTVRTELLGAPMSTTFLSMYSYVASTDAQDVFRVMNVVTGDAELELPLRLRCRSMSVGDLYVDGDVLYLCEPCGWKEIRGSLVDAFLSAVPAGPARLSRTFMEKS